MTTPLATRLWMRKSRGGTWGPWHQGADHHLTFCGSRMPGIVTWRGDAPPADERRCATCEKAVANGRAESFRGRR